MPTPSDSDNEHTRDSQADWAFARRYLAYARPFFIGLGFLLLLEFALARLLPGGWMDTLYFKAYMPWLAGHHAEQFIAGDGSAENCTEIDATLGWRNRPNTQCINMQHDDYGSRTHSAINLVDKSKQRLLLLGDSRIYGHRFVDNDQTLNAYLEDAQTEALNLAAPRYHLDQLYLLLEQRQAELRPDRVIIGISTDTIPALACMYVLFFAEDPSTPWLKPRFTLGEQGKLQAIIPPYRQYLQDIDKDPALLAKLAQQDQCYAEFQHYQHWQATPLLGILDYLWQRGSTALSKRIPGLANEPELAEKPLLNALLKQFHAFAQDHKIQIVFLLLPNQTQFEEARDLRAYQELRALLVEQQLDYLDALPALQADHSGETLYEDEVHFSAYANRLLADALKPLLKADL